MNRALSAFLIALLLSVAHAAVPVIEIYPKQAAPGGLIQVKIDSQSDETCTGTTSSLSVWIGSHTYQAACEDHDNYWFLIVALPEDPLRLPQMGPQVLNVMRAGERPGRPAPLERNIQIMDRVTGVLSVQTSGTSTGDGHPVNPQKLSTLFNRSVRQTDSVAVTRARNAVVQALNGEGATLDDAVDLPGSVGICGSTIYRSQLNSAVLQRQVGILIQQANLIADEAQIMVAPDTARQPPSDSNYWSDTPPDLLNAYAWNAIRLNSLNDAGQNPVTVHLIDTFDPQLSPPDPFTTQLTFKGRTFESTGHGSRVAELIRYVAPTAHMTFTQACNGDGVCSLSAVMRGLCLASAEALVNTHSVIVHLSLATPYDHPILHGGVSAAAMSGAALVFAYGNSDRCLGRAGGPLDYCNAYPADWSGDAWGGTWSGGTWSGGMAYSVGASQQTSPTPQTFQRGQHRWTWDVSASTGNKVAVRTQSAMPVATQPSLSAPGFFFLPLTDQGTPASDAKPYWGTSFAAPLVTGALVRWVQAGHAGWPKPSALRCGDLRLDLRSISGSCWRQTTHR